MSVTYPCGFRAAGIAAGIKRSGALDLALVVNDGPSRAAAAVFTANRAQANPILWSKQAIADGQAVAIVLNSGGANCFTGPEGFQVTHRTAEAVADALGVSAGDVLVCSTGLIGEPLDGDRLDRGARAAANALQTTEAAAADAARAIMTTDTRPKQAIVQRDGWSIGGMAKGAGMLAPGLATMLVVLTTDADVDPAGLDAALRAATAVTFDRLDVDGCMSTNDQVSLLASGASGVCPAHPEFVAALTEICDALAGQLHADAEGASHEIAIVVRGAHSDDDAVEVGRAVARNNLVKAAIFGNDPNWGRVLAAIGTARARFDPYLVDVTMNGIRVCHAGRPDRHRAEVDLTPRATEILIELHAGTAQAVIRTTDLTHAYVHENSAYAS